MTKQSQSVLVSLVVSHHTTIQVSHNRYCPVTVDANENHSQLGSHVVDCRVTLQAGSVRGDAGPYKLYLQVTIQTDQSLSYPATAFTGYHVIHNTAKFMPKLFTGC